MTPTDFSNYLLRTFDGLSQVETWGETSFFYNPGNLSPRGTYFCTIKDHDGEHDQASALYREGIWRMNFGITRKTFLQLFKSIPQRPSKGGIIEGHYDFIQLDHLVPHPVYGWMCWVAILSPSEKSLDRLKGLILESYQLVLQKHQKKHLSSFPL